MVMTNGIVGNNTHRPLRVEEFRGFTLVDKYAPIIFLNSADAKSAQMFTLLHEATHVWLGVGGISNSDILAPSESKIERFCDRVAAEFLVPEDEFLDAWDLEDDLLDEIRRLSRHFKVSPLVIARRALDLGLLPSHEVHFIRTALYQGKAVAAGGGGDFYRTAATRLGERFARLVFTAVHEGRLGFTEAYELTDLHGRAFSKFGKAKGLLP
ncbi:ImmA/IrrE family metallo-endopeptidase [Nannocystis pusilla]|uniref:ImmA/IrrE family metallo-endopeptidase n=1 Tax=Nannocystis pusilla TaxID=889268 RepID=A0A9X3IXS7_9BACT|nr:ImmA/IrrE family metallo-endopeptidase [Nannocystis pusilla]MCY1006148.1 ImmA/IrrE family metallo-endopeptidase [Nannocystis pusilla]